MPCVCCVLQNLANSIMHSDGVSILETLDFRHLEWTLPLGMILGLLACSLDFTKETCVKHFQLASEDFYSFSYNRGYYITISPIAP